MLFPKKRYLVSCPKNDMMNKATNEQYLSCSTACQLQCGKPASDCPKLCIEGCFCIKGYIRDYRGICISDQECAQSLQNQASNSRNNHI